MMKSDLTKRALSLMVAGSMLTLSTPLALAQTQMPATSDPSSVMDNPAVTGYPGMQQETQVGYPHTMQRGTVVIPSGTGMTVTSTMATPWVVGEQFTGELVNPVMVNGATVFPAGAEVRGDILAVNRGVADVQFREVALTTGEVIPLRARTQVSALQGGVQQQGVAATGQPTTFRDRVNYVLPQVTVGGRPMTPGGKILAGTVGGAAFGGATGALTGLVWPAVYREDIDFGEGTGTLRGLAWGAAMGAGLGLVSGLAAAAIDREQVSTTTTTQRRVVPTTGTGAGLTNITTGSLEEIPVAYPAGANTYSIILSEPVTVTM